MPVTDYALFGGKALASMVAKALQHRDGCLLANHGAVTTADTLSKALWRMEELENLARIYTIAETSGTPTLLTKAEIDEVLGAIAGYGQK